MNVSVFGLGYVGCVSVACLSRVGHRVTGVDIVKSKVDAIARGLATVVEPQVDDLLGEGYRAGRIDATTDVRQAVLDSDISLVCVGTPSGPDGALDLTAVRETAAQIGQAVKAKGAPHLVVLRSTVPPGTVESLLVPAIRHREDTSVVIIPEFLRESTAVSDYFDPPLVVVGTHDGAPDIHQGAIADLLAVEPDKICWVPYRQAEMVKSLCNVFHAMKVAFANEVGALCEQADIRGHDVMELLTRDRKLNISSAYLRPGLPYGGSCLPKDLAAVCAMAQQHCVDAPLLRAIGASNEAHKRRARSVAASAPRHHRVGMDGLAFKADTDDLRESPMVAIAEHLIGKGYDLRIYDRAVQTARLNGANQAFVEQHIPHLASRLVGTMDALLEHSDTLVLTRESNELVERIRGMESPPEIIDLTLLGRVAKQEFDEPVDMVERATSAVVTSGA